MIYEMKWPVMIDDSIIFSFQIKDSCFDGVGRCKIERVPLFDGI